MTDTILESLLTKFRQRSEVGQKKYNTTLDRKDLTLIEWLNHAQEEAMDLCLYLEKIKQTIKNNNDEREI
jgi:succinate dehydrogenase flavin-adding protein (antitoxin of CptAB toxin-antitoxin module)